MRKEQCGMDIPGFDGYSVKEDGVVVGRQNRPLKPYIDRHGYQVVSLLKDGKNVKRFVHQLVALTFIPNPEKKQTVNHINGVKTDNRVENLEWATQSENNAHAYRANLATPHGNPGARNGRARLTDAQVADIRTRLSNGKRGIIQRISELYGVSREIIANIRDNKTYKISLQ